MSIGSAYFWGLASMWLAVVLEGVSPSPATERDATAGGADRQGYAGFRPPLPESAVRGQRQCQKAVNLR